MPEKSAVRAYTPEKGAGLFGYNAPVSHNGTSHDEQGKSNVWTLAARYAVAAASHGAPMVYIGQPLGIPHKVDFQSSWQSIKAYWDRANPHVLALYKRINEARANNPALRGTNSSFLRTKSGGFNDDIFSAARWSGNDVILVFVNLRNQVNEPEDCSIPHALPLHGKYQAVNLVANDSNAHLWPQPRAA